VLATTSAALLLAVPSAAAQQTTTSTTSSPTTSSTSTTTPVPTTTTTPPADIVRVTLPSGRAYAEHPPALPERGRRPLVIALHGWMNTPQQLAASTGLNPFADQQRFLVAYGLGIGASWNAGDCCGQAVAQGVDDLTYLAEVAADVARRHRVDPRRVYVVGFSNGGMMAERAACQWPGVFAAAGSGSGPLLVDCHSPLPVRIRHLHGSADTTVPPQGGFSPFTGTTFPSLEEVRARVAGQAAPGSVFDLTVIEGMGHRWPTAEHDGLDGTAEVWRFLQRYRRCPVPDPVTQVPARC
jgi:poly(3-hydroxybutyrate) depolymerase